jgi:hypothetical protein
MNTCHRSILGIIGALAVAGAAYGAQPPDVVTSDGNANTAMGTDALQILTTGVENTASGSQALYSNTTGTGNTASGANALHDNSHGADNTAVGDSALYYNTIGHGNTASGLHALFFNSTGSDNMAAGVGALYSNTTGDYNVASGFDALYSNTTGDGNNAVGYAALFQNLTGDYNTAVGYDTLYSNTTGTDNNAAGYATLHANTTGSYNNAMGVEALYENTTGSQNSAVGYGALYSNTDGNYNVGLGYFAGFNLTTGSNNIDINNRGVAGESGVTRIGVQGTQVATYIAGIYGTSVTGSAVVVSSTGQLGVTVSSERFKTAITPMGSETAKLGQLRPVSFKLKSDATGTRQYGLIAEEVANVYPELVIRDASGRIDGVRYDELAPMLLNEAQKQQSKNAAQDARIRDLEQQVAKLTKLNQATQVALRRLQTKDQIVAERLTD